MIQQSHFWVYIQKRLNHCFEELSVPPCSLQHYLQQPRHGNNLRVNRRMNKENMICIFNGILFSHKKEILPFATTWMKLDGILQSEISQT